MASLFSFSYKAFEEKDLKKILAKFVWEWRNSK